MDTYNFEELAQDYRTLQSYMDSIPDHIYFKDRQHVYVRVNKAMATSFGCTPEAMTGKLESDLAPGRRAQEAVLEEDRILASGDPLMEKVELICGPEGRDLWLSSSKVAWRDEDGAIVGTIGVTHDITHLRLEERSVLLHGKLQDILLGIMQVGQERVPVGVQLEKALRLILSIPWLPLLPRGGIFLLSEDAGALGLVAHANLAPEIQASCARVPRGRCLCGRAMEGTDILFAACVDDRHDISYPGMPPHGHYCIPIRSDAASLGLMVLYVDEGHRKSDDEIRFLTTLASALAMLIERERSKTEMQRANELQDVLNAIIRISVQPLSLKDTLDRILELLLSIPWLTIQAKGSIFVVEDAEPGVLHLFSQSGLHEALLEKCARLPFGTCLCGLAAATRRLVFRPCLDPAHGIGYDGMMPHGHYCLPILANESVLGVLNLYVADGYARSERIEGVLVAITDTLAGVIQRKRSEAAITRLANFDTNTGLPNRALFGDRLTHTLAGARRYGGFFSVLFLDLDHFKLVNDTLGHDVGDLLLKEVGRRLAVCVRESDTASRLGGDEFAVILSKITQPGEAAIVARRMIEALSKPFYLAGHQCSIGVSIGISVFPQDGVTEEDLLKAADDAMYRVKKRGRNDYEFNSPMDSR